MSDCVVLVSVDFFTDVIDVMVEVLNPPGPSCLSALLKKDDCLLNLNNGSNNVSDYR